MKILVIIFMMIASTAIQPVLLRNIIYKYSRDCLHLEPKIVECFKQLDISVLANQNEIRNVLRCQKCNAKIVTKNYFTPFDLQHITKIYKTLCEENE